MPSHFQRHLRGLLGWAARARNQERYPRCCIAIRDLRDAAANEAGPANRRRKRRQPQAARPEAATGAPAAAGPIAATGAKDLHIPSSVRVALWRAKTRIKELTSKLAAFQSSKGVHNVLTQSWILRVMLIALLKSW